MARGGGGAGGRRRSWHEDAEIALNTAGFVHRDCHPSAVENCPHCDAPLKPAARFCLACDRPVEDTSRLSVGAPIVVSTGRPLVGLAVAAAVVLGLAGAVWGGVAFFRHLNDHSTAVVVDDVKHGTTLLVAAEGGQSSACGRLPGVLAGPPKDVERECAAIVGDDPSAKVTAVTVDRLHLQGLKGTAHVHATVSDAHGTHTIDRVVDLVRAHRVWRLQWDGQRET
jgi:hypothetical protein